MKRLSPAASAAALLCSSALGQDGGVLMGADAFGGWKDDKPGVQRHITADDLEEPFVSVVPVDPQVARVYGQLFCELRRAGTPIPVNDVWIAAATIAVGAHLLTFDRDFDKVDRLVHTCFDATAVR